MILSKDQHLLKRAQEYLVAVDPYTFPIYAEKKPGTLELVGTGVAVRNDNERFLLTAAHVIQQIDRTSCPMLIADNITGGTGKTFKLPQPLEKNWRIHPDTNLDIAVAPAGDAFPGLEFFPLDECMRGHLTKMPGRYFLAGFPCSQNKARDINVSQKLKRSGIASIIVSVDQSMNFSKNNKSPNDFLGFYYKGVWQDGIHKNQGISLRGMSGCGLWYFHNEIPDKPRLAGILIEYFKDTCIGYATMSKHFRNFQV